MGDLRWDRGDSKKADDLRASLAADTRYSVLAGDGPVGSMAHAMRWSPSASSCQRRTGGRETGHWLRYAAVASSRVGVTLETRAAKGPAWDSRSALDAGVRSEKCILYRCQL
ncbi:unnamed protein product [Symbiodinium sp. KB8]|nr:unnamed protein product [Symbiodinium sp. KB8]